MQSTLPMNYRSARGAMVVILLSTVMATLAVSSVNILLPELTGALNASYADVQWVAISYMIALSASLVSAGKLSDIYGHRLLFLLGISIFTIGALCGGLASTVLELAAYRAIQGVGAAIIVTVNLAIIGEVAPRHKTGAAIGLIGTMSAIGTASGPVLGGALAEVLNWQVIFFLNLPFGVLLFFMAFYCLPATRGCAQRSSKTFDIFGASILTLMIVSFAFGLKFWGNVPRLYSFLTLSFSGVLLFLFWLWQARIKAPVLEMSILADRWFSVSLTVNFVVCTVVMAALIIGPFYLTEGLGLSLAIAGLVMAVSPIVVGLTSFATGQMLKDDNLNRYIIGGLLSLSAGTVGLAVLRIELGVAGYIGCLILTAVGYGSFTASNNTLIMQRVTPARRGQLSGLLNLSRNLGLLTGATLMSTLFDLATEASVIGSISTEMAEHGLNSVYRFAVPLLMAVILLRIFTLQIARRE